MEKEMSPQERAMTVKLYGSLRQYGNGSTLTLRVPEKLTVSELRSRLKLELETLHPGSNESDRLDDCAFADESRLFQEDEWIENKSWVAVLPPVCGG